MALSIPVRRVPRPDPEELACEVAASGVADDVELLASFADRFAALIEDPNLVVDALRRELHRYRDPAYVGRSISLPVARVGNVVIRANVWSPHLACSADYEREDDFALYSVPHNHDFSFMTVGYSGPGYETAVYEYAGDPYDGEPGDLVRLTFLERTRLSRGKVMVYRKSSDAHVQFYPTDTSVSLNLIRVGREDPLRSLYTFDLDERRIVDVVEHHVDAQEALFDAVRWFPSSSLADGLEELGRTHPHPKCRAHALRALDRCDRARRLDIIRIAETDAHTHVRSFATVLAREP
jgi:hypothetical protein